MAVHQADLNLVRFLIEHGADAKQLVPDNNGGHFDISVLNYVRKDPEIAKLLMSKGADPNAKGSDYPAIHAVAMNDDDLKDRLRLINVLLAGGADVDSKDSAGFTTLTSVVSMYSRSLCSKFESELPLISLLVTAKADPTIVDINGDTVLCLWPRRRQPIVKTQPAR